MVLTGVLSKMGVYGFVRLLLPLFPHEIKVIGPWLLALAICSIVFAPLAAWAQRDLKRMIAYLSINHLGYCMLALFAIAASPVVADRIDTHAALSGVFMQIFNHGITAATLFYFVGLLEQRRGLRGHRRLRGSDAADTAPLRVDERGDVFVVGSAGIERIHRRVFDFQRLLRARSRVYGHCCDRASRHSHRLCACDAITLFSGPLAESCSAFPDLLRGEKLVIVPVTLLMFAIGIAPQFLFNIFNTTVVQMARLFA